MAPGAASVRIAIAVGIALRLHRPAPLRCLQQQAAGTAVGARPARRAGVEQPGQCLGVDDQAMAMAVDHAARAQCTRAFAAYVGMQWDYSLLDLVYLTDYEDTWKAGKVTPLICLVLDPAHPGDLTRSLRGAHH